MPRIWIQDPWGYCYRIDTARTSTLLPWFDEILPIVNEHVGSGDTPSALINVHPMWSPPASPDWLTESRAICGNYHFYAKTGNEGIQELVELKRRLEKALAGRLPWEHVNSRNYKPR